MDELSERQEINDLIHKALNIIQGQKSLILQIALAIRPDSEGIPHLNIKEIPFNTTEWQPLPDITFSGQGRFRMIERTDERLVLYYQLKPLSYFVKHTVDCAFSLHVCYGEVNCTVSGGTRKKGETGEAVPSQYHQLCFPVETGMIITFDLTSAPQVEAA